MSIWDKQKTDPRLRSGFKAAAESTPNERINNSSFPGEDGEYLFKWTELNDFEGKDGTTYTEFVFQATADNDPEVTGKKCNIFMAWKDSEGMTMEDVQEQFYQNLQLLGIETAGVSAATIESEVKEILAKGITVKAAVVTSKKNSAFRNLFLRGTVEGGEEEDTPEDPPEAKTTKTTKTSKATKKAPTPSSPATDEWEAETETEEEDWKPSTSIGYECVYEGKQWTVTAANDEDGTIEVEDETGDGYTEVPFSDVAWVEEEEDEIPF